MKVHTIVGIFLVVGIGACNHTEKAKTEIAFSSLSESPIPSEEEGKNRGGIAEMLPHQESTNEITEPDSPISPSPYEQDEPETIDTLHVAFDLLKLSFPGLLAFDDATVQKQDTIQIWLDLAGEFNEQVVHLSEINPGEFDSIRMVESYRTTLSIMNEGPHLDLYEWIGHESEWLPLREMGAHLFLTKKIAEEESKQFPLFTREELIEAADTYSDGRWGELIRNPPFGEWTESFWIGVGLRRLKVELFKSGKKETRVLEIYIPMGC